MSGLGVSDFNDLGWWQYIDFEITPGNDTWYAPPFKVDGNFVGTLDANDFYSPFIHSNQTVDPNVDSLTFTFKGDGYVEVNSYFTGYNFNSLTKAYNIQTVETNYRTNDKVYGDENVNYMISAGGSDVFYGIAGQDIFVFDYNPGRYRGLEQNMRIEDYESGSKYSLGT